MTYETLGRLLAAGVAAGTIRSDMQTGDVMLAMNGLLRLDITGDWRAQASRLLNRRAGLG